MKSNKQRILFEALSKEGTLIFASGVSGVSANLVGNFRIRQYKGGREDRLDVDGGTHHVHIDWRRLESCDIGKFHGEGMLTFFESKNVLFKIYKPSGSFSSAVSTKVGELI